MKSSTSWVDLWNSRKSSGYCKILLFLNIQLHLTCRIFLRAYYRIFQVFYDAEKKTVPFIKKAYLKLIFLSWCLDLWNCLSIIASLSVQFKFFGVYIPETTFKYSSIIDCIQIINKTENISWFHNPFSKDFLYICSDNIIKTGCQTIELGQNL